MPAAGAFVLDGAEGRHAATVRRMRVGEQLEITDGTGGFALASVIAAGRGTLELDVADPQQEPRPQPRVVLVQAVAKGERGELAVELATEAGVDEIVPWRAGRSIARWDGERGEKALARWRSTAESAAKQSRRHWWPSVLEPETTAQVAARLAAATLPVVLHENAANPLSSVRVPVVGEIVVVVGPEGGISDDELDALGGPRYRLGPSVFRTSSAGLAAAAVLLARTPRWGDPAAAGKPDAVGGVPT